MMYTSYLFVTLAGALTLICAKTLAEDDRQENEAFIVGAPLFFSRNATQTTFKSRVYKRWTSSPVRDEHGDGDRLHRRKKRSTSFSTEEIAGILNKHNELRGQVSPEAANMEFMVWDDTLATMAQQWSDECLWEHGQPDNNISPFSSIGQNLWLGTGSQPDGVGSTQSWYNEVQYYDYDTGDCTDVCGHYTQVVWDSSYALGCGRTFCSSVSNGWTNAYIVTCNYGPAGNYAGAQPYTTGSSCTKCESGVGQCYNNLCRPCSDHSEACVCYAVCYNCGTLNNDCTCTCRDGYHGSDCSTVCENTHEYCGASPGWPTSWCDDDHPYVLTNCPLMCGTCNAANPDDVCDPTTSTAAAATTPATNAPATNAPATNAPGPTTSATTTTTTTTAAPTTVNSCDLTCQNGGTLQQSSCTCRCTSEYQGDECEQTKSEVRYGVIVIIFTSINRWTELRDLLIRIVAEIVTTWCNDNFSICCPNLGTKTGNSRLSYVEETHVSVASGFPRSETGLSREAFRVMLLVAPPQTTDLCSSGSEFNSVNRRKKRSYVDHAMSSYHSNKRFRRQDSTDGYLDQDALFDAISSNVDMIEDELNVTLGEVTKGEVVVEPSGGGLAPWVIAIIVVFVLLAIVIVLVIAVIVVTLKGKSSDGKVGPNDTTDKDPGFSQPTR